MVLFSETIMGDRWIWSAAVQPIQDCTLLYACGQLAECALYRRAAFTSTCLRAQDTDIALHIFRPRQAVGA
jgi:hypothetical protein